jgi:hypothetical protein
MKRTIKLVEAVQIPEDELNQFFDDNEYIIWADYANEKNVDLKDIDDDDVDYDTLKRITEEEYKDKLKSQLEDDIKTIDKEFNQVETLVNTVFSENVIEELLKSAKAKIVEHAKEYGIDLDTNNSGE